MFCMMEQWVLFVGIYEMDFNIVLIYLLILYRDSYSIKQMITMCLSNNLNTISAAIESNSPILV